MPEKIETSHKMTITLESFRNEDLARAIETLHELLESRAVLIQSKHRVTITLEGFHSVDLEMVLFDLQEHIHHNELKVDGPPPVRKYPFNDRLIGTLFREKVRRITPGTPMDPLWSQSPTGDPAVTGEPEPAEDEEQVEEEVTA